MNSHSLILINQPCKAINALILIRKREQKCVIIITYDTKRNRDSDLSYNPDLDRCVYKHNLTTKVNKSVVNNTYAKTGN